MKRGSALLIVIIIILIIAVVFVAWMIFRSVTGGQGMQPQPVAQTTPSSTITYLPNGTPSYAFPLGLPIDGSVAVWQNFQTNNPPPDLTATAFVSQQSVYEYVTSLSLAQAYADYLQYFSNNGWQTVLTLNQPDIKSINVQKGQTSIVANFTVNTNTQQNVVNLLADYQAEYFPPGTKVNISVTPQTLQKLEAKLK